ncbi:uncharacterized protein LOC131298134 isoform X1 [Rhododendron vialii]|uniref:uncharacterized protein LOC131298134 isoform X1 n=1 Tax=Rhododendron vialii TaxID=182163 RepID=UPI00265DD52E|nr:uncharacterized protein LOC131298134 isoform X1 [Rhododendron vialii]
MALTNLILTVAGVSAVVLLMRSDVKQTATIFRRNVRQIRHWLEQESTAAAKFRMEVIEVNWMEAVVWPVKFLVRGKERKL